MLIKEKSLTAWFLVLAFVIVLFDYSETVFNLLALWSSDDNPTYSHGLLLVVVSGLIIFREWRNKQQCVIKPGILPVLMLMVFSLMWFLAALGTIQIVQMLLLVTIMSTFFWAVLGFNEARPFFFPMFLMLGAMPIWEVIGGYLQITTAFVVGEITKLTIIPSMRDGMHILIPAGNFEVATGCSGLSYLVVATIISALFCYLNEVKWLKAVVYVLVAMMTSIVANIIRVYIIIVSGQMTNMQSYFVTVEHVSLGWAIFAVGITLYLWLANRSLSKVEAVKGEQRLNGEEEMVASQLAVSITNIRVMPYFMLLLVATVTGPLLHSYYQLKYEKSPAVMQVLPEKIGGWSKGVPQDAYKPYFGNGLLTEEALYSEDESNHSVYVYMNYYYSQTQGKEAVNDLHHIADGRRWHTLTEEIVNIKMSGFDDVLESRVAAENGEEKLVWQWYETNQKKTGRKLQAKIQNIIGFVLGDPSINIFVIAIDTNGDVAVARSELRRFLRLAQHEIKVEAL